MSVVKDVDLEATPSSIFVNDDDDDDDNRLGKTVMKALFFSQASQNSAIPSGVNKFCKNHFLFTHSSRALQTKGQTETQSL